MSFLINQLRDNSIFGNTKWISGLSEMVYIDMVTHKNGRASILKLDEIGTFVLN